MPKGTVSTMPLIAYTAQEIDETSENESSW